MNFDDMLQERRGDLAWMNDSSKQFLMNLLSKKKRLVSESHPAHKHINGRPVIETVTRSAWCVLQQVRNQLCRRFITDQKSLSAWMASRREQAVNGWSISDNSISDTMPGVKEKIVVIKPAPNY